LVDFSINRLETLEMRTLLLTLLLAAAAIAQSPVQHVVQGGLEVWTGIYSNMPDRAPEAMRVDPAKRIYGLSIIIVSTDPAIVGYRIQADVTFEDGPVVHVDELRPTYWGCWYREAVGSKTAPVKLSGLVITPVTARPAIEILLQ
jgi:hypothetical protein